MKFNLGEYQTANEAFVYLVQLTSRGIYVDIKVWNRERSLPQNAYLHLLLAQFGQEFGYTLQESKNIYKQLNATIYRYKKNNHYFWRSSADLDKKEFTESIQNFRDFSESQGLLLPPPTDRDYLEHIENEIERTNYR